SFQLRPLCCQIVRMAIPNLSTLQEADPVADGYADVERCDLPRSRCAKASGSLHWRILTTTIPPWSCIFPVIYRHGERKFHGIAIAAPGPATAIHTPRAASPVAVCHRKM